MNQQSHEPQPLNTTDDILVPDGDGLRLASTNEPVPLTKLPGPVTLAHREGVFAHSFKCGICDLEFVLFSWMRHRHTAHTVTCPECGVITPMIHWLATLSTSPTFTDTTNATEIYDLIPCGPGEMMDDTQPPPDIRYG